MPLHSVKSSIASSRSRLAGCSALTILVLGTFLVLAFGRSASYLWLSDSSQHSVPLDRPSTVDAPIEGQPPPAPPPEFIEDDTAHDYPPDTSPDLPSLDTNDGRPLAVVIETKATPNLIPLMLHVSNVLGPSWTVVLFTLEKFWEAPESPPFRRAEDSGRIEVRYLPPDTDFPNSRSVSAFLTGPWLWEQLLSADRILMWQTDSVLCSKSPQAVEDFFEYDLVGAPIAERYGQGYNGGLSIRNPRLFHNITLEEDFAGSGDEFEDQWFYKMAKAREGDQGVRLPSVDVAKTFAVETIYYERPLGYHQPQRWQKDNLEEIEEWCPEVKMLIGRRAT